MVSSFRFTPSRCFAEVHHAAPAIIFCIFGVLFAVAFHAFFKRLIIFHFVLPSVVRQLYESCMNRASAPRHCGDAVSPAGKIWKNLPANRAAEREKEGELSICPLGPLTPLAGLFICRVPARTHCGYSLAQACSRPAFGRCRFQDGSRASERSGWGRMWRNRVRKGVHEEA